MVTKWSSKLNLSPHWRQKINKIVLDMINCIDYTNNMKMISIKKIPDELHKQFKIYCTKHDTNMREALIKYMEKAVKDDKTKRKD